MARQISPLERNDENIFFLRVYVQPVPSCYGLPHAPVGLLKALGESHIYMI